MNYNSDMEGIMLAFWTLVGFVLGVVIGVIGIVIYSERQTRGDEEDYPSCSCDFNDPSYCHIMCSPKKKFIEDN